MRKELWVYINPVSGEPDALSLSLLAKAQELALTNDFELCAVIVMDNSAELAASLAEKGVPKVYEAHAEGIHSCEYMRIADLLQPFVLEKQPEIVLFPASDNASLVASTLAVRLKTGCTVHCASAEIRDGFLIGAVPAFGGQMMSEILCPLKKPQMATVRLSGGEFQKSAPGTVIPFGLRAMWSHAPVLINVQKESSDGVPLESAEVLICCGAGMADAEGWSIANDLAKRLGGAACCTRNTLDLQCGATEKDMVGISGKTVAPKVYLGFGVSGSAHHTCGMRDSGLVLNVNNNKNNPFFPASDCGYVGDAKEIARELLKILK